MPSSHHDQSKGCSAEAVQGDANEGDDRLLYNRGQRWLKPEHIMGRVKAYLPLAGVATIIMNEWPIAKYALIGILALTVLGSKE